MGRELLGASTAFRRAMRECADALAPLELDLLGGFAREGGWDEPVMAAVGLASLQVTLVDPPVTSAPIEKVNSMMSSSSSGARTAGVKHA
jgi:hypothetical protein